MSTVQYNIKPHTKSGKALMRDANRAKELITKIIKGEVQHREGNAISVTVGNQQVELKELGK